MSQLPMRMLHELIAAHGRSLCDNAAVCRQMLLQACPLYPRQVEVIVAAAELGIVNELFLASPGQNWYELTGPMVRRLTDDGKITELEAISAIEAWVQALGIPVANAPFAPLASMAEVEERQRQEAWERGIAGGWAGASGGAGVGFSIALAYATLWLVRARQAAIHGQAQPFDECVIEWIVAVVVGTMAGAIFGGMAGAWLRHVLPSCARMIAGAVVGLVYGIFYSPLLAPLVENRVDLDWVLPIQILLASLIGLVWGTLVGLVADFLPRQLDRGNADDPAFDDTASQPGWPFHP